jgi:hypothetical protein
MELGKRTKDLTGQTFERLKVVKPAGKDKHSHAIWNCLCACGKRSTVQSAHLVSGHTTSCGCLQRDTATTHGHTMCGAVSPEYQAWKSMLSRCNNHDEKHPSYANVFVCRRWRSFENFLADMGERPAGTTLSRFRDSGDYKKSNCAWHTWKQQRAEARKKRALLKTERVASLPTHKFELRSAA